MKNYLQRLLLPSVSKPSYELLCAIQRQHIENIPWENLDIYFHKTISLDFSQIMDKFIRQNRGGICFELNGAYYVLLKKLGFNVKLVQAQIFAYEDKVYQRPRNTHVVSVVEISGRSYLSDVAWDGNKNPLALDPSLNESSNESHVILKCKNDYQLHKKINNNYTLQYQFTENEIKLSDMECYLDYSSADPEREVASQLLFKQYTATGYRFLTNEKVIFLSCGISREESVSRMGGLKSVLTDVFQINNTAFDYLEM